MSLFSKNLRYLRKKGSHKQDDISNLFNKKANTIGNWENQKSEPSLAELIRLGEYFNVSIQALLHSDLEKESQTDSVGIQEPGSALPMRASYSLQESMPSLAQEGSPDAFWLILQELRAVNEKLDLLQETVQTSSSARKADKSSH